MLNLDSSNHGWVNDPTSVTHLQLNELIEHIAVFVLNYKIKYIDDSKLIELVDEYLDDSFMLFSNYSISGQDLQKRQGSEHRLFQSLINEDHDNSVNISLEKKIKNT